VPDRGEVEGFVLAGGASSRFGSDKALARDGGPPFLVRALDALGSLGLTPRVVTRDAPPYARWARAFVMAERPGLGPAEGLRAALRSTTRPWALVLAVDMPGVTGALLRPLLHAGPPSPGSPPRAVCYSGPGGRRHPLPGLYPRGALDVLERLPDDASLQSLLDAVPHRLIGPADAGSGVDLAAALRNVNRPEDRQTPP
jgi:molybdenum cofactor guanylyltransferase